MHKQTSFFKTDWTHQHSHREHLGRKSLRDYKNFALVKKILARYAKRFFIKVEQVSVQADHIHCLLRNSRRSHFHYFFRVTAGQIAQQFQNKDLLYPINRQRVTDTPFLEW